MAHVLLPWLSWQLAVVKTASKSTGELFADLSHRLVTLGASPNTRGSQYMIPLSIRIPSDVTLDKELRVLVLKRSFQLTNRSHP